MRQQHWQTKQGWRWLWAIIILGLALRVGYMFSQYTSDLHAFQSGDYTLYRIGADNFAQQHNFTNSIFLVRPPLFPLIIYAVVYMLHGNDTGVLAVNVACGVLLIPLTFALAWQLFPQHPRRYLIALGAAALVAIEPTSIIYSSAYLGAEASANALLIASVTALLLAFQQPHASQRIGWGSLAGLLLVLSALSRPAPFTLWLPLSLVLLWLYRHIWRTALTVLVPYALLSLLGVQAWTTHNGSVFGNSAFSTIGPYTMTYYRAAAVEHLATGQSVSAVFTAINRRVEERLARGTDLSQVDDGWQHRFLAATVPVQNALYAVSIEIFAKYPLVTMATLPVGLFRMLAYVQVLPMPWRGLDMALNVTVVLLCLASVWVAWRRRDARYWIVVIVCVYFMAGVLLVKSAGMDTRERSQLSPVFGAAAMYALVEFPRKSKDR